MENSIARIAVIDNHLKMFPRFFSVGKIASFVHGNTLMISEKAEVGSPPPDLNIRLVALPYIQTRRCQR